MSAQVGWLICGALLLTASAAAAQQNAAPHTLTRAAELALERYPALAASAARVRAAESASGRVASARWPTVQLNATATQYQEPMLTTPLHRFDAQTPPLFDETLLHGNINARYTLWDGGERRARIQQADARVDASAASLTARRADVLWGVTQQYARVQALNQAIKAHAERLEALSEELRRVRQLVTVGKAPRLDLTRAEAALAAAEAESVRSRTQQQVALGELARLTGTEPVSSAALRPLRTSAGGAPARAELLARALEANPTIARARHERAAARAEVKLARSAYQPQLRLFGNYDKRGSRPGDVTGEWNVGTGVSYPLFQGGARRKEVQRARAEEDVAESELEVARLGIEQRLDAALAAFTEADALTASLSKAVDQFANVVKAERLALQTGVGTQTDYLTAQADLLSARAQLAEAAMNRIVAHADIARVTGKLSVDWIRENLETRE